MRSRQRQVLGVLVVIAGVGLGIWAFWPKAKKDATKEGGSQSPGTPGPGGREEPIDISRTSRPTGTSPTGTADILTTTQPYAAASLIPAEAQAIYKRGKQLMDEKKFIEARVELSKALASGHLGAPEEADAVNLLSKLAEEILFTRKIVDGDPYALQYMVQPGESLEGAPPKGIERRMGLHVPSQLILRVNGIRRPADLQAHQAIKLIRGPFHAIITKSKLTMDAYLGDVFVRRYRIGIGAKETPTPSGFYHLTLGGKLSGNNTPYTPPVNSGLPMKTLLPKDPGYPLDAGGHWMSLTGIPEKGTNIPTGAGYGIHGTNDPTSVGKAVSHGCVRLLDKDIEEVFSLLYEKWSTVEIRE